MKITLPIIIYFFIPFFLAAQAVPDSVPATVQDVIVKTNGNMFQCQVVEVNDSLVQYTLPLRDTSGTVLSSPRSEVYAIAYRTGITQVITPELMGKQASIYPKEETGREVLKNNLASGTLSIGLGFIEAYSPLKDVKSFEDEKVMPSIAAGYSFVIKKKFMGGLHLGIGGNELTKSGVSEYDQLRVSTEIEQKFICLGLFGRYNFVDGAFRPYVKAGLDFMGVIMKTTSIAESLDGSNQSLQTEVDQSGIKLNPILRGGLEVHFGNLFGIYGDVGTGLSLVQVGVIFNL